MKILKQPKLNLWERVLIFCGIKERPEPVEYEFLSIKKIVEIIHNSGSVEVPERGKLVSYEDRGHN